jgi:two-component system, NarL family, sensor histidine kinase DegS
MKKETSKISLDQVAFNKLRNLYLLALLIVAITVISSQLFVQYNIQNQLSDSRLINFSGRQRMLSQKLVKELLVYNTTGGNKLKKRQLQEIQKTLSLWTFSHESLKKGSDSLSFPKKKSPTVNSLFAEIDPVLSEIVTDSKKIIASNNSSETQTHVDQILKKEVVFLKLMNQIVNQYDKEAREKVKWQSTIDYVILSFTLLILLLEFFFIFKPTAKYSKDLIEKLLLSEKTALKLARDTEILSEIKENSAKELKSLNFALDNTLLYSRVTTDGKLIHIGERFLKLIKNKTFFANKKFSEVIASVEKEQTDIHKIIINNNKKGWKGEISITNFDSNSIWLDMSVVPVSIKPGESELLVICFDITERKIAEQEVKRLNKINNDEKINQQKIISSKIVENQENEQNRIAKEIHDGIGQMLTGLKFSIESINLEDQEKTVQKLDYIKKLSGDIIQGVRTATFNLMPPELSDHGIVSSLLKLAKELSRLTGKKVAVYNKTNYENRLDSLVEINLYRVTQEAINNAIKYADSNNIIVQISHSEDLLSITIDDDGNGFDVEEAKKRKEKRETNSGGMGLLFMKERMQYVNGRFFIQSIKGQGTRITINVPI